MAAAAHDLTVLVERLRSAGFRVDTRQYLTAHELMLAFAARGRPLEAEPGALASHLGPVFCTQPDEQRRFAAEVEAWSHVPQVVTPFTPAVPGRRPAVLERGHGPLLSAVAVALVLALVGNWAVRKAQRDAADAIERLLPAAGAPTAPASGGGGNTTPAKIEDPTPPTPGPFGAEVPWRPILLVALFAGVTALAARRGSQAARHRLALRRFEALGEAEDIRLTPERPVSVALPEPDLRRLAASLRRPQDQAVMEFNAPASIEATIRAGGLFAPVFTARRAMPEYLMLVQRRSADDHWAQWIEEWIERLTETGVVAERLSFDEDPRICFSGDAQRTGQRLQRIVDQHQGATLFLFAEAGVCFHPLRPRLAPWMSTLNPLPRRVLFTPEPPFRWGTREWALAAEGYVVLPAGLQGLRTFGEMAGDWRIERMFPAPYARAFPKLIADEPARWLDRNAPPADKLVDLVRELRGFLGPQGFGWLCACAVYPQISWPLTIHLAEHGATAGEANPPAPGLNALPALARLPWMRAGFMPDWLRAALISQLSPEQEGAVRARLESLLERLASAAGSATAASAQAPGQALTVSRWIKPLDLLRAAPAASPLGDRVFLGFMRGERPDALDLEVGGNLRDLFGRRLSELPNGGSAESAGQPDAGQGAAAQSSATQAPSSETPQSDSGKVFLSYRAEDADRYADRIAKSLLAAGVGLSDKPSPGSSGEFSAALSGTLEEGSPVVVVIGPRWARSFQTDAGVSASASDPVSLEVAAALSVGARLLPVLVGGASMPDAESLPPELRPFAERNALELRDESWDEDFQRLLAVLGRAPATAAEPPPLPSQTRPKSPRRVRLTVGCVGGLVVVGIVAAVFIPNVLNAVQGAKSKRTLADLRSIGTAIEAYGIDNGADYSAYPAAGSISELPGLLQPAYIQSVPLKDGWDHDLRYQCWADEGTEGCNHYRLASPGRDGRFQYEDLRLYSEQAAPATGDDYDRDLVFGDGYFLQVPSTPPEQQSPIQGPVQEQAPVEEKGPTAQ